MTRAIPQGERPGYDQEHAGRWQYQVELVSRSLAAHRAVRQVPLTVADTEAVFEVLQDPDLEWIVLTAGQEADITQAEKLIEGVPFEVVIADKGYDKKTLVEQIEARGAEAVIPTLSNRKEQRQIDNATRTATWPSVSGTRSSSSGVSPHATRRPHATSSPSSTSPPSWLR